MSQWYYAENGAQYGPLSENDLKQLASSGRIRAETLVWADGMAEWLSAKAIPSLWTGTDAAAFPAASAATVAPSYGSAAYPAPLAALAYEGPGTAQVLVTERAIQMLKATKPWVRFLSVLTYIGCGLMVTAGAIFIVAEVAMSSSRNGGMRDGGPGVAGAVAMFAVAAICLAGGVYLGQYATRIGNLVRHRRSQDLEAALQAQKSYWKYMGILTVVGVSLYGLMIVGLILLQSR